LGNSSGTGHQGRQFWIVAAEREDAARFIVRADEMLTVFLELERAIRTCCELTRFVPAIGQLCFRRIDSLLVLRKNET
jgi:hypothetical protein